MKGILVSLPYQDPSVPQLGVGMIASGLLRDNIDFEILDLNLDFINFIENIPLSEKKLSKFFPSYFKNSFDYLTGYYSLQERLSYIYNIYPHYKFSGFNVSKIDGWPDIVSVKNYALLKNSIWNKWITQNNIIKKIQLYQPDWIGLSINFEGQLPPALVLGSLIKKMTPISVIFGGGLINAFKHLIKEDTPIWDCVDGIVIGPGEDIGTTFHKTSRGVIPYLAEKNSSGGWILYGNRQTSPLSPNFSKFSLNSYRCSKIVLPYRVFSECNWNRCSFCADAKYANHNTMFDGNYILIAEDILKITTKYGADGIYFLDAELPTDFMYKFASIIKSYNSKLKWGSNCRISNEFTNSEYCQTLYQGGCRFLRFGLESASNYILKKMNKGITSNLASRVIKEVFNSGIAQHIYIMSGFIGEKKEDFNQTLEFIYNHILYIDSISLSQWVLYNGSSIMNQISKNDILITETPKYWSYPQYLGFTYHPDSVSKIENDFFIKKGKTRCFPSTGDSIILGEKFEINYSEFFNNIS